MLTDTELRKLRPKEKAFKVADRARHQNNVLGVLDAVFRCAVKGYLDGKSGRSPAAVLKWLKENGEESIVKEPTLRNWLAIKHYLEQNCPQDNRACVSRHVQARSKAVTSTCNRPQRKRRSLVD